MNKFKGDILKGKISVKNFLYILVLSLAAVGCRQTETAMNAPAAKIDDQKTSAIRLSAPNTDAAEPAIAADADGNLYVLYVEHAAADKSADVYFQKFDSQKEMIGERVRVNPQIGEATAWRGDAPTIVVSADKIVYAGWTKRVKSNTASGTDLCLSVSRDGGKSFDAPVKVNDDIKPASHGMHSLAIGKDGAVYLAWLDERNLQSKPLAANFSNEAGEREFQFVKAHHNSNQSREAETKKVEKQVEEAVEPNSEVFFAASNDGGKTFAPNVKLSGEVCPCCKTSLLVAADNRIYASWRQVLGGDFRHIAVASSTDLGKTFSAPVIVSNDQWKINACPVSGAALALGKNNALEIAWFTAGAAGQPGLYQAQSNDAGATFSGRVLVSENAAAGTPIFAADENGNFKIVWEAGNKIYQSKAEQNSAQAEIVAEGNLPAAAAVGKKLFIASIKKENEKRVIWLTEF